MEENLLSVGIKIEMTKTKNRVEDNSNQRATTYVSQIMDMDEDVLTCAMPIFEGHIIPLETGSEYDVYFYTKKGIYRSDCQVVSRGKEGNIYICQIKLLTELSKFQRRQFFRLPCTLDIVVTPLMEFEMLYYLKNKKMPEKLSGQVDQGVIVDISGGGIRVISKEKYDKGSFVALSFLLNMPDGPYKLLLLGKIIFSTKTENDNQLYDQRIQFREISRDVQDEIVKFIFEEQRRLRRKERG